MKVLLSVLALVTVHSVGAAKVTPVQKVIQLMEGMAAKGKEEKHAEQVQFAAYKQFCDDTTVEKTRMIKEAEETIEILKADIQEYTATAAQLTKEIAELDEDISIWEGDIKAATKVREIEKADYDATHKDYSESIDALQRAIGILEREMAKSGAAMVQLKNSNSVVQALSVLVHASALSAQDGTKLTALIQNSKQAEEDEEAGAPEAATYEGHSSGIIETLENLLEEAEGQLSEARKKETSSKNNYEMLKQSLEDDIANANKDLDEAKKSLAASGEAKATAQGDLTVTSKALAADISTLDDLHKDCLTKAQDFEAETTSRTEELKALAEAKKILKETTAGAEAQTYGLNQESFLQITSKAGLAQFEAVRLVRDLARKENSRALAQLASRLEMTVRTGSAQIGRASCRERV